MQYDVIIAGGGTSGVAAAYIAGKLGVKTLLVEKDSALGGAITSSLVIPAMKTVESDLNTEFFNDFIKCMKEYSAQVTYSDGNKGWFNPEYAKIVLDEMMLSAGVDTLFLSEITSVVRDGGRISSVGISSNMLSLYCEAKYLVDATGNANLAFLAGADFLPNNETRQPATLRFIMANVDLKSFGSWLLEFDPNRCVSTVAEIDGQTHLSTACTWDLSGNWALYPIFQRAVVDGVLEEADTSYFQLFTITGMPASVVFNCPRIMLAPDVDPLDPVIASNALLDGRRRIARLCNFCKIYLPGFSDAYLSNIAATLGVRESRRVKTAYVLTGEEVLNSKEFENPILYSDYPIDIHSMEKEKSVLAQVQKPYQMPIESLLCDGFDNLLVVGRCVGCDFYAQGAIRVQTSCFSMGEAAARYVYSKL